MNEWLDHIHYEGKYPKILCRGTSHQCLSTTGKVSTNHHQQEGRVIGEDVVPQSQPFISCKHFTEGSAHKWPCIHLRMAQGRTVCVVGFVHSLHPRELHST